MPAIKPVFEFVNREICKPEQKQELTFLDLLLELISKFLADFFSYLREENRRINQQKKIFPHGKITFSPIHREDDPFHLEFQRTKLCKVIRVATQFLIGKKVIPEETEKAFYTKYVSPLFLTCAGQARGWMISKRSQIFDQKDLKKESFYIHIAYILGILLHNYKVRLNRERRGIKNELLDLQKSFQAKGSKKDAARQKIAELSARRKLLSFEKKELLRVAHLVKQQEKELFDEAGLQFIASSNISLTEAKSKPQLIKKIEKKLKVYFKDPAISDILFAFENHKKHAAHELLLQPDRIRVYDSKCGEIAYDTHEKLIKDLMKRLSKREFDLAEFTLIGKTKQRQLIPYTQIR